MTEALEAPDAESEASDPRALLAEWANANDEWVRLLVAEVIAAGRPLGDSVVDRAYELFRQEKKLDERDMPPVEKLSTEAKQDETAPPLTLTRLSDVRGVNALVTGEVIQPHEGLTILYGENGTGKTGYSRIFKSLADSRTADAILGNIDEEEGEGPSGTIEYKVGDTASTLRWKGERGVSPFTRMSIFDSPSVSTHVDDDLDYVYVPAALALFNHVSAAIQAVASRIEDTVTELTSGGSSLLSRFQRGSSIYPEVETLGASTDLEKLKAKASADEGVADRIDVLTQAVAALKGNTIGTHISARKGELRVLQQALAAAQALLGLDASTYNATLTQREQLQSDYEKFRTELFAAADLPAEPDNTWGDFIDAGDVYRRHLVGLGVHDADRCLYCRQSVEGPARDLLSRYSTYLEDKISKDIRNANVILGDLGQQVSSIAHEQISAFLEEYSEREDKPPFYDDVKFIDDARAEALSAVEAGVSLDTEFGVAFKEKKKAIDAADSAAGADVASLEEQSQNRDKVLAEKQEELLELKDSAELAKSWTVIEGQVNSAKEADRLRTLKRPLSQLSRGLTELAKTASDQLINQSFDALFIEECEALRAPELKVQFVGREGKAHRRKVLRGQNRQAQPSKVLSEGEQKVLAMADFLAEARLAGITAPVIFDDPVSSLDHRRINEVAARITNLAQGNQVIVFTHDIFFATTLLGLVDKSKRFSYFQITDEGGKGFVTKATGPRSDTVKWFRAEINRTIETANQLEGESRDALVRQGYSLLRSWCEVFTENELLRGVTKRYQANVVMGNLGEIKVDTLSDAIPKVQEIFDLSCRYMEGHSQPMATLGVSATLTGLEEHWRELQQLKSINDA